MSAIKQSLKLSAEALACLSQIMKTKFYLLVISFLMALTFPLSAENITVDGIKYETTYYTVEVIGIDNPIENVIIPEYITYNEDTYRVIGIGDGAFNNCTSLTSITIPNSVSIIGIYAFSGCSNLTDITIPESVISIGNSAFYCCSSLTSITIPNRVTSIEIFTFMGCTSLTSVTIPESVTRIRDNAFYLCTSLTSVTIPNRVTSIEGFAFYLCSSLTSVTIPESVTSIDKYAFYGCSSLTSIILPSSVTNIGINAFQACSGLLSITCLADTPPTAYTSTFDSVDKSLCTLYVKKNTASLYASATGWSDFANIVEIDDQNMGLDQILTDPSVEMIYDLSGNRVPQIQKGRTYIRNGKKILVK